MSTFRTVLPPFHSSIRISHQDRLLCIGSCFAEAMGARLAERKFPTLTNPFGIVFNPVSIARSLGALLSDEEFDGSQLIEQQGLWHSFEHHGSFSHPERELALGRIQAALLEARAFLQGSTRLLVTLGTANVFNLEKTGEVVANCHKFPAATFGRRRLGVEEVAQALNTAFEQLKQRLPHLEIITSVSPVRHLRDGLLENQRSKATLLLALDALSQRLPYVHYFPAYELLLDDLRDYRFYDTDMAHPSPQATDYIWGYFGQAFFDEKTSALCQRIEPILAAAQHRPFHPQSAEHQLFVAKQLERVAALEREFPFLNFAAERQKFEADLEG